jgi:hypothetical protein
VSWRGRCGERKVARSRRSPACSAFLAHRESRKFFNLPDEQFRVACYLYADHIDRQREVEYFWLSTLRLPATCLGKSIVNVYSRASKRKRINMLPHGTCRLTVSSTRVVQHIYGAIQGYGGFDRPEWLD